MISKGFRLALGRIQAPKKRAIGTSAGFWTAKSAPSNAVVAIATASSIGSVALYCCLYGNTLFAATPTEEGLHPPQYPWPNNGFMSSFDHASLRRGYLVYKEVCSSCHSLSRIAWRNLVGVTHTVAEAKSMAEEVEYTDGPDDQGEMFTRPGKLADYLPAPYANEEAARAANMGALPPDLSLIVKARHGGADYIYSIITGYPESTPAGLSNDENQYFNPYFPGVKIAMARALFDGLVEYDDGTPGTTSQYAKDVVHFLNWAAEPEHDERKKMGFQVLTILSVMFALSIWIKRFKWAGIKNRRIVYNPPKN